MGKVGWIMEKYKWIIVLIKQEDLQIGDEIIIGSNGNLKYLKVLKLPRFKDNKGWERVYNVLTKRFDWNQTAPRYTSARLSIRQDSYTYKSNSGIDVNKTKYVFEQDVTKHNKKININLTGRDIFLIKRNDL